MENFEQWKSELLHVGKIVQDSNKTISPDESERLFNRYIEMLDALTGTEGYEYALAVFESVQMVDDYGAYQTAERAAWRFGEDMFCRALLQELPRFIKTLPDWAGDFLVSIANADGTKHQSIIRIFNEQLTCLQPNTGQEIKEYIHAEEENGWLAHRKGVLRSYA